MYTDISTLSIDVMISFTEYFFIRVQKGPEYTKVKLQKNTSLFPNNL